MNKDFDEVTSAALQLSIRERARLFRKLIESLGEEIYADPNIDTDWIEEARPRMEGIERGEV